MNNPDLDRQLYQPSLAGCHRLDLVGQLPLPALVQVTNSMPCADDAQLQALLDQPSVMQGVQHALSSTRMSHM
jgi:hypothetical protein